MIELLVVVVIIGILASIALPQFEAAIEKSRLTEALVNTKAIVDAVQRYDQAYPEQPIFGKSNISDVILKGGTWNNAGNKFTTRLFIYQLETGGSVTASNGKLIAYRTDDGTTANALYQLSVPYNGNRGTCSATDSEFAYICTFFNNI